MLYLSNAPLTKMKRKKKCTSMWVMNLKNLLAPFIIYIKYSPSHTQTVRWTCHGIEAGNLVFSCQTSMIDEFIQCNWSVIGNVVGWWDIKNNADNGTQVNIYYFLWKHTWQILMVECVYSWCSICHSIIFLINFGVNVCLLSAMPWKLDLRVP